MRTRLKILAATLGALIMLSGVGYDLLLLNRGIHSPPAPELVPPWACPKAGSLFALRGYNTITSTFYHALAIRTQEQMTRSSRIAEENFRRTLREVLEIDGRLLETFNLVFDGALPPGYFSGLLEEKRINALMDTLRPCPASPFLPGSAVDAKDLYPQTGARLAPRPSSTDRLALRTIPVTFDLSGLYR